MAKEEFEIEIAADGTVTVKTIGMQGPECVDAAAKIVEIIGEVQSQQLTQEYYQASERQSAEQQNYQRYDFS